MILENGYKYAMNCMSFGNQCSYMTTKGVSKNLFDASSTVITGEKRSGNCVFRLGKLDYRETSLTGKWNAYSDRNNYLGASNSVDTDTNKSIICNVLGLWIGKGTTEPVFSDYKMEDAILFSDMSISSKTRVLNTDKYIELAYTFQNKTENPITVTELGLYTFAGAKGQYTTSDDDLYPVLLARKIIDPVTVGAGYFATFNYRWNLGTPEN